MILSLERSLNSGPTEEATEDDETTDGRLNSEPTEAELRGGGEDDGEEEGGYKGESIYGLASELSSLLPKKWHSVHFPWRN